MKQSDLPKELSAIEARLEKARAEIESKLTTRIPVDTSWALVPTFTFKVL